MKNYPTSKIVLSIAVLAALGLIAWLFLSHRAANGVVPAQVAETVPLPVTTAWPSTKVRDETISDNGSYYTIAATYPVTQNDVITGYFKTFIDAQIAQFKEDTSWAAGNGANAAPAEAGGLSLAISYTEQKSTIADNYIFNIDTYTGGAHDLQATKTFSFSPTGQQIALSGLFTNGISGLSTIASYVQTQLSQHDNADSSMIADGTTPTQDNYQSFVVTDTGLTFIFDPYQVAPYSEGTQTVQVPLNIFKNIANPDIFGTN